MRIVLQRVLQAQVQVNKEIVGKIQKGALVFVGCHKNDTLRQVSWMADKLVHLRMFRDKQDKMNLSLLDEKKEALLIPQFTLYGDCRYGRRPSFTDAMEPIQAKKLFLAFVQQVRQLLGNVQTGVFGAHMEILAVNDGPVTFVVDSK